MSFQFASPMEGGSHKVLRKKLVNSALLTSSLAMIFSLSGCLATADPNMSFKPPQYVEEIPAREVEENFGNAGSLFGQGDNPIFADRRAMKLNDLVTVVINENVTASSTGNKAITDNSNFTLSSPSVAYGGTSGSIGGLVNSFNNMTSFGVTSGNNTSTFNGTGNQNRQDSFVTTISARIIKVMENGNYFIEGGREIMVNGEKQIIRLTGVIRPYDIGRNNTINSQYIADAKIMYDTEGEIRRSMERGWGTKLITALWPF
ncbi:flagellar basal body L-ring protein FlgH [Helicobacter monodelphidis]|uniref:flagellar basal body L-ring protein FlgH n=1 Tax=Helicobacter sp. 15-1451 TaxID=2004995 RepID=UPI00215C83CA|nr:flagellar basal body L-ring protein FlgH [Helicobacter sp. 15-1451]